MNKSGRKRAVIWNAHWLTLGGGERYALCIVQSLVRLEYDVLVLGNCDNPGQFLIEKFGEDFCGARYFRVANEEAVHEIAKDSDIFVNASYGSMMQAPIDNSFYICHFPETSRRDKVKSMLFEPIENLAYDKTWKRLFPSRNGKLTAFNEITLISNKNPSLIVHCLSGEMELENCIFQSTYELQANDKFFLEEKSQFKILNKSNFSALVENLDPPKLSTLVRRYLYNPNKFFFGYKKVISNSNFTSHWIEQYWGVKSFLLYPPVKIGFGKNGRSSERKATKILSVGRFIEPRNGHSKNQLELVKAFKKLQQLSEEKFELHLVGGLDTRNQKYFEKVKRLSRDTGVVLYPNASAETLDNLYRSSTFYWHATGLNVSKNKPEKMEHFGISVVEAIGNGLIPVVFDSAGPSEILVDFPELRFQNLKDLVSKTLNCRSLDSQVLNQLSYIPARYDESYFYSEFQKLIGS